MASQPPVLTDDDIMRFRSQSAPASQPASPQPITIGRPDPLVAARENRAERSDARAAAAADRAAAAAERSAQNVPSGYRASANGGLEPIPGGPADPTRPQPTAGSARSRQLPNQQIQRLSDGTANLANLERALNNFHDDYGGNLLGGVENTLQNISGSFGTPGQAQFWSDVAATDNVARNALFGASLTEGEKAAWEQTTINPRMDPAIIRQNLTRRVEIARAALGRLARTNAANGFNREAIEASLGDYSDLLRQGTTEGAGDQAIGGAAAGTLAGAATGQGDFNFARQVQGAPEGSPERFQMLEMYHRFRQGGSHVMVGGGDPNDPNDPMIDAMGATEEQGNALLAEYERELPNQQARQAREQFASDHPVLAGADTFVRSAANAMTLGMADRIAGTMNGTGPEVEHAITGSDWQNRPITSLGGTLAGGYVLPVGSTLPRQIGAGAAYSGAYGYNATDGSQSDRVQNALISAASGAGISAAIGGGFRLAGRRNALTEGAEPPPPGGGGYSEPPPTNPELVQAANRQGVDLMPADFGSPALARATGGTRQTIGGSGPVARGVQRTEGQVGGRVAALAQQEGRPLRQEVMGDRIRTALENFNNQSGEFGRGLYREAGDLSHDVVAQAPSAFRNLNNQIRELAATAPVEGELVPALERFRRVIADEGGLRPLGVDSMRRLRTAIATEARSDALRGSDYLRRANEVLDNVRDDISHSLNPQQREAFLNADRAWAERLDFIDNVENNILGPRNNRSAEGVASRLLNLSRSDSAQFRRVLDTVSAEEAGIIRGSVIQELGRAADGSPNAGGFSLDTFLTSFEKLPDRTRDLLFRGQSRADVNDLVAIARARRVANQSGNFSNTSGGANVISGIHTASSIAAWPTLGGSVLLENLTGRLLASRRFVRFLANPPREPSKALRTMRRIAIAEPGIRGNIETIIQGMQRAANDNAQTVTRAAASGTDTDPNQ